MRNLFNKATGTAIAIAAAAVLSTGSANAQATVLIDATTCGVVDAVGAPNSISPPALGGDAVIQQVLTDNGNSKITCNGTLTSGTLPGDAGLPNRAVIFSGPDDGSCSTGFGSTNDWHLVVTKSGRVALTCHVNINQ